MLFVSIEDFYRQAKEKTRMTREEEIACAKEMQSEDSLIRAAAKQRLVDSYTPMIAAHIKRMRELESFSLAIYCMQALEKAVERFNFLQESETFTHRLNWWLRQATTAYIVR